MARRVCNAARHEADDGRAADWARGAADTQDLIREVDHLMDGTSIELSIMCSLPKEEREFRMYGRARRGVYTYGH